MVSSKNPFRAGVSPDATGDSETSSGMQVTARGPQQDPSPDLPAEDPERLVPPLPPSRSEPDLVAVDLILEELPPAYTPSPDTIHGESTLELGPRRPFQQPQRIPREQQSSYLSPDWQRGHHGSASTGDWAYRVGGNGGLPPRHPTVTRDRPRTAPSQPMSDFARDFYGPGAGAAAPAGDDADGRPTRTPKPGHPLLRHGKVLVYPSYHECNKCHNVGYRNNDPTTPCFKCWDDYSRPFSGALASMSWDAASLSSEPRVTYQRPLPRFTPPHLSGGSSRASSLSRLNQYGGYSGGSSSRVIPIAGGGVATGLYLDSAQGRPSPSVRVTDNPPPGATVLRPGDPRLGGRLCWRCGGTGITTFLIFDESTCSICDGVGRTFV